MALFSPKAWLQLPLVHTSVFEQHPSWCSLAGMAVISQMGRYGIPELQLWRGILSVPPEACHPSSEHTRLSAGRADTPGKGIAGWGGIYLLCSPSPGPAQPGLWPPVTSGPAFLGPAEFGAEEGKSWLISWVLYAPLEGEPQLSERPWLWNLNPEKEEGRGDKMQNVSHCL